MGRRTVNLDVDTIQRLALVTASAIGGIFAVRYQRQLALQAAQTRLQTIQEETINAMAKRITEAKETLKEHEHTATEYRVTSLELEACQRERTALEAIVEEWDRRIGNIWLEQSRPVTYPQPGVRTGYQLDQSQPNGIGGSVAGAVDGGAPAEPQSSGGGDPEPDGRG
jgi:beta-glucosidase-like glycosyl hydrolase